MKIHQVGKGAPCAVPTTPHRVRKTGGPRGVCHLCASAIALVGGAHSRNPLALPTLRTFFMFADDDGGECSAHLHILAAQIAPELCSNIVPRK
jgi:hypothetical protein